MMTEFELDDIRTIYELPYDYDKLNGKTIFISGGDWVYWNIHI